ncbi:OsmC family protein [Lawsonia intracellularis]|uniref:Predicted redox protein, regulator of disulfide bond formation n=1 Tax=Lawsonia intracellularis (strain PHE/MN1-00) TaxID=363253 RepID=Q1MQ20_LAWIP|nr:OsmC family protein [Lawsonia intracellularis]AGC50277.1 OsmC family protein [Lawsonia intracellularis N343]KAA0204298.1 OsmC family peroxiredoxin [Lawsonia intracellularis]MBZ3892719.1 OsmC family protein [Lawsonia intracellularis]OMQ02992.1 disulfide bond formation regulator [Lawsonia intracellularis]RBN33115.1 OsmC family peroxiredoxin [Lawsonia intracellularis]
MSVILAKYIGNFQVECLHVSSGTKIITDPPLNNYGQSSSFSSMDLFVTSITTCIITAMHIHALLHNIKLIKLEAETKTIVTHEPKRIKTIEIILNISTINITEKDKIALETIAKDCPLCHSLHPALELLILFHWS